MAKTNNHPLVYQRKDSPYWFVRLKNPITGKVIRKSTGMSDYDEAFEYAKIELMKLNYGYKSHEQWISGLTLKAMITLYSDPDTNPRFKQAQDDGSKYGKEYAFAVASHSKWMLQAFNEEAKNILDMDVAEIRAYQLKVLKGIIVAKKGHTRGAQIKFTLLKTMFSQAHEDGIIDISPAKDLKDIAYKEKRRSAVDFEIIYKLICAKDRFLDIEDWAFYTLLATTGMRRSEVLAINANKIHNGVYTLDSAIKSNNKDDIGLPKWDIVRVIPLPRIALWTLSFLTPAENGRYFDKGRYWAVESFKRTKNIAISIFPEERETWEKVTAHILRHSLNTNLLANDVSPVMTAYYLAWQHQALIDMQQRYTHLQAMKLKSVADNIDIMFPIPEDGAIQKTC